MLVVLGAVGLARFAFGMILPTMAADLNLGYQAQGILGASYFLGYLAIVAVMPWAAPRLGSKRLCVSGLAVVTAGLIAMAMGTTGIYLYASYFVVGLGSGSAFIGAMSLPSFWFRPSHRARGAGVVTAGAGIGILSSGFLVPAIPSAFDMAAWQLTWALFAAATALFCVVASFVLKDRPAEIGCTPYGRGDEAAATPRAARSQDQRVWPFLTHLGIIYAIFAATGLTYTTFIVTTMVDGFSLETSTAGLLWAGVGGLSIFSGTLFGSVADRWGYRAGMFSALAVQAVAYALIAGGTGLTGLYVSIALFGLSAWSMPSIVAAAAGDYLGPEKVASGFAILTIMFAAGQVAGPAGAGVLADWTGSFEASYGIAAGLNIIAVTLCLTLRAPARARV
jgi:MFS family permease